MEHLKLIIEGVSEIQIQKDIERMSRGWKLFFVEPTGANYNFIQPFWGFSWDGTSKNLKEIILKGAKINDKLKQHICIFKYNGKDMFAWCSWTTQVYDFTTKKYYKLEGNRLSAKITTLIENLMSEVPEAL